LVVSIMERDITDLKETTKTAKRKKGHKFAVAHNCAKPN
jgi:hypothetical protein